MTRAELEALLEECFGAPGRYEMHYDDEHHLAQKMRRLRAFVGSLPSGQEVEVWADEF